MSEAIERTASWLDGSAPSDTKPAGEAWACVEIFGHRKHYGRISEVEKFGAKMLRVDVPTRPAAPLLNEPASFETFVYGGAAIFSITPLTEDAARKWAAHERGETYQPMARLPSYAEKYVDSTNDDSHDEAFGNDDEDEEGV